MAEGQFAETPATEITTFQQHVGRLSDRAIQRLVGGNAFLRGRIYARRNAVSDLQADVQGASCRVLIRADEPIDVSAEFGADSTIQSKCSCQAWRGPTGHCKHVAALLVALRDRERPPKPKQEGQPVAKGQQSNGSEAPPPLSSSSPSSLPPPNAAMAVSASGLGQPAVPGQVGAPGTGKRRRSR